MTVWLCRAGLKGEYEGKFADQNRIFLIGNLNANLTGKTDMPELMALMAKAYPNEPDGSITTMSVQGRAFSSKVKVGDLVIVPGAGSDRLLNVGEITGAYEYDGRKGDLRHSHAVDWRYGAWKRESFDDDILASVDAFDTFMLFFKLRQDKRIREIVTSGKPFAKIGEQKKAEPKKSVNKPETEPIEETEPAMIDNTEIKEVIAEVRETITIVRKANITEAAKVSELMESIKDLMAEVEATITEVKKTTVTNTARIKEVIAEVKDALEEAEAGCCSSGAEEDVSYVKKDVICYKYDKWYYDSVKGRRCCRR
ncbi:MAG: hypothetical protein LBV13_00090 [Methanomassiliicoccaceae archaeon]|jgi:predicted Mrr-cat superfamily restriction endonuclease|nr:hypothetical protein [Methanomassiliicoccaceae archaeon]